MILYLPCSVQAQSVIFSDSFDIDPSANGWTESIMTSNTALGDIHASGVAGQAVIDKTGGSGQVKGALTRTISTLGFENIDLELIAFQSATSFEGGGLAGGNTDYLSILIDTGGGFVPLFERTGIWAAPGSPGFSDGGTGAGRTTATSSGIFSLGIEAANNPVLMIQILGQVTANAEDYFFDWFNLRGTAVEVLPFIPAGAVAQRAPKVTTFLIADIGAIHSVNYSGLPMALINQQLVQSAPDAALRGLNNRLFTVRVGGLADENQTLNGSSDSSLLRYLSFIQDEHMSYKVALGLADAEENRIELGRVDTLSAGRGVDVSGLPYAMMAVPLVPMTNGIRTVHIVDAGLPGKTVIDDSRAVVESETWDRWELFAAGDFSFYDQNQLSDLMQGFDAETYAGSVGLEYRVMSWLNVGLAWSYLESDSHVSGGLGDIELEGNLISTYATVCWRQYWVDLLYSYGSFNSEISRNTGSGSRGRGYTGSDSHSVRLNLGRNIEVGRSVITGPIVGWQYGKGDVDPYSERSGGTANLDFRGSDFESMVSRLGWQVSHMKPMRWCRLVSQVHLVWEHEYMPENGTVAASLQTSPFALVTGSRARRVGGFSAESGGAHPGTDWMSAGAGLRFELDNGFAVLTDYQGAFFRNNASQHFGSVKVSYEW